MGDGARLAIAILMLFIAMVCFFFAFHPGGASISGAAINNPDGLLQFLFSEFETASKPAGQ